MKFEWDENKNRHNQERHFLHFDDAKEIFNNPTISIIDARRDYGEVRYIDIGVVEFEGFSAIITIVYTKRRDVIRIISARKANKKERKMYNEYIKKRIT